MLLHFDDEAAFAAALARASGLPPLAIGRHRFPDGELKLTLPAQLPAQVVLLRSLAQPNEKLIEVLLAARTARELGARQITLVAPYLAYMRQDMAFAPGEAVSQRIIGGFLAGLIDTLVTVDPHLHRVADLAQAVPGIRTIALSAAPLIGRFVQQHAAAPLLLGPDAEAAQWVEAAAAAGGFDWAVCRKVRHGDRAVQVALPSLSLAGRQVVLVDDVASTGHTLMQAARAALAAGSTQVDVAVTHALFVDDALAALRAVGVRQVWSTDCIAHPTSAISVVPLLAAALQ